MTIQDDSLFSGWTDLKVKFFWWWSNPERDDNEPQTAKKWASLNDVHANTLSRWANSSEFEFAHGKTIKSRYRHKVQEVLDKVVAKAVAGSFHHAKLFLDVMGVNSQKLEIEHTQSGISSQAPDMDDAEIAAVINELEEKILKDRGNVS